MNRTLRNHREDSMRMKVDHWTQIPEEWTVDRRWELGVDDRSADLHAIASIYPDWSEHDAARSASETGEVRLPLFDVIEAIIRRLVGQRLNVNLIVFDRPYRSVKIQSYLGLIDVIEKPVERQCLLIETARCVALVESVPVQHVSTQRLLEYLFNRTGMLIATPSTVSVALLRDRGVFNPKTLWFNRDKATSVIAAESGVIFYGIGGFAPGSLGFVVRGESNCLNSVISHA